MEKVHGLFIYLSYYSLLPFLLQKKMVSAPVTKVVDMTRLEDKARVMEAGYLNTISMVIYAG